MNTKRRDAIEVLNKLVGPLTFGDILESYRKGEEKTLKEYAKFLGISASSLCDLEKGRKIPSIARAVKIAKKLKEPAGLWVQLAIQDQIKEQGLDYRVSIA